MTCCNDFTSQPSLVQVGSNALLQVLHQLPCNASSRVPAAGPMSAMSGSVRCPGVARCSCFRRIWPRSEGPPFAVAALGCLGMPWDALGCLGMPWARHRHQGFLKCHTEWCMEFYVIQCWGVYRLELMPQLLVACNWLETAHGQCLMFWRVLTPLFRFHSVSSLFTSSLQALPLWESSCLSPGTMRAAMVQGPFCRFAVCPSWRMWCAAWHPL